jgi:FMN phosphatase YigB (HAD superfamily)
MMMIKTAIRADGLPTLLADAPPGVAYLSLDCFDTLIWRAVHSPADVFTELPLPGGAMNPRVSAEIKARRLAPHVHDRYEVTLDEIHAELLPDNAAAGRADMLQAELDAEARHCYAFAPTRDLIADAKRRGLQVIIVSDTYLTEARLRRLIEQAAGPEVLAMIDRVFCSCDYGVSKTGGLFKHVLATLDVAPEAIFHVGDNPMADQEAPSKLGINSVHLHQFDAEAEQRLRLEAAAASLIDPLSGVSVPVVQLHRPQLSLRTNSDPAFTLGHDVLGPLMHGFARWIRDEAAAMEAAVGKPVKLLFLLRDGHLPAQAFAALFPDMADRIAAVEISRFTATAASFTDKAAIERYLTPNLLPGARSVALFARQMLLDKQEWLKLAQGTSNRDFGKKIALPSNTRKIVTRSRKFADRMFAHLRHHGIADGDAVMMIDLGYNGSVQNVVEPVLRAGMNLDVAGRYLLLREIQQSGLDKKGFFDVRHYDFKALFALSEDISIVEQLCTIAQGSVVDYKPDGTPIRSEHNLKGAQSDCRDAAQHGCLAFLRAAGTAVVRPPVADDEEGRRRTAMGTLARLLFLPLASEVALLQHFHHDVNMGTGDLIQMVDVDAASEGLRRRGLFYIKNAKRIYLPGELQRHGLPLNLSILSSRRFGLDLRKSDFDVGAMQIPITLLDGNGNTTTKIEAHPTADGYYQALIPIGDARFHVGLRLGRLYDYVQVEEVAFQRVNEFMSRIHSEQMIPAAPICDKMEEVAPGLYRLDAPEAFMLVPPPAEGSDKPLVLSFVFRPVVTRAPVIAQQQAA